MGELFSHRSYDIGLHKVSLRLNYYQFRKWGAENHCTVLKD